MSITVTMREPVFTSAGLKLRGEPALLPDDEAQRYVGDGRAVESGLGLEQASGLALGTRVLPGRGKSLSNIATLHPTGRVQAGGALAGRTYNTIVRAPVSDYGLVRLICKNLESSTIALSDAAVAVTNSAASNAERIVSSQGTTLTGDSATGWVRATFAGATGVTLPARISATEPSVSFSDWVPCQPVAPIDGSPMPYQLGRIYIAGAAFSYNAMQVGATQSDESIGLHWYNYAQAVDGCSNPAAFTSTTSDANTTVFGFEFMAARPIVRILGIGDSLTQGQTSANTQMQGWLPRAVIAAQPAVPVALNWINGGFAARTTTEYAAYGKNAVSAFKPDVVFYSVYSPNDNGGTLTQPVADAMFWRAIDIANHCLAAGSVPVLTFVAPRNANTGGQDAIRKALIARCKATGFAVCDMTSVLGDGASPEQIVAAYNQDGTHITPAGYAAAAAVAARSLVELLRP